ncbi:hypothetical protein ACLKA6_003210 [Drosophila palustris]
MMRKEPAGAEQKQKDSGSHKMCPVVVANRSSTLCSSSSNGRAERRRSIVLSLALIDWRLLGPPSPSPAVRLRRSRVAAAAAAAATAIAVLGVCPGRDAHSSSRWASPCKVSIQLKRNIRQLRLPNGDSSVQSKCS